MKNVLGLFILSLLLVSCQHTVSEENNSLSSTQTSKKAPFGIVIHGGAGSIREKNMSDSLKQVYRAKLKEAITQGYQVLKKGGTSVEAVREAIKVMENSPLFNAGKGAVFTHKGTNEMDASIMNGENLKAGAVAGVTTVKNPIDLAFQVMVNSPHVLLYGKGAEAFAQQQGLPLVDPSYFYTQKRFDVLQRVKAAEKAKEKAKNKTAFYDPFVKSTKYGTVGCVALDQHGNLAAGTSTGGMTNKQWNRIGDSPIIGAGTYANNKTCAISCTGWGEYFIRGVAAYDVSAMMEYGGSSLKEAAHKVTHEKIPSVGGGGLIGIDAEGNMVADFNTPGMFRAMMSADGTLKIAMFD